MAGQKDQRQIKWLLTVCIRFAALGMITSMAEECGDATVRLPRALSLAMPVGCIAGLFFVSCNIGLASKSQSVLNMYVMSWFYRSFRYARHSQI